MVKNEFDGNIPHSVSERELSGWWKMLFRDGIANVLTRRGLKPRQLFNFPNETELYEFLLTQPRIGTGTATQVSQKIFELKKKYNK
jgi:hypothetical protein